MMPLDTRHYKPRDDTRHMPVVPPMLYIAGALLRHNTRQRYMAMMPPRH